MSIAIIGAGNVGAALAAALSSKGQKVVLGVNTPDKCQALMHRLGANVSMSTVADALAQNDLIILAVPYLALQGIANQLTDWQGKIVVDATNPLAPGLTGLLLGTNTSGAEEFSKLAHGARVVKAFNTIGAEHLEDASFTGGMPMMPICGDDAEARLRVKSLVSLIGFEAIDMGSLSAARIIEPMAMAWIHLAIKLGAGRNFAFGMLRK